MTRLAICSLFDRAIAAYGRPMFVPAVGAAVRSLTDEANNPESELSKHPEDYDLYDLGFFDDADASFTLRDKPLFVVSTKSLMKNVAEPPLPLKVK